MLGNTGHRLSRRLKRAPDLSPHNPRRSPIPELDMQKASAIRQLIFSRLSLVFERITARILRALAAVRSALFYRFLFLSIGSAIDRDREVPEGGVFAHFHDHQDTQGLRDAGLFGQ